MRIEAYTQVQQAYQPKTTNKAQETTKKSALDQVQISSTGKDFQYAKHAIAETADIRTEKTEAIQEAMKNGTYQVSTQVFAERVISKYQETKDLF